MLPHHKEEVKRLLQSGDRLKAFQYARDAFQVSLYDAVRLVNTVDQEMNPGKKISIHSFSQDNTFPKIITYVLGALGTFFLAMAIFLLYSDQRSVQTFTKTKGVVVANLIAPDAEGPTYAPEVTYKWEGEEWTYRSGSYSNPPSFQIGEQVDLYVDPSNPSNVFIDSFSQRFVGITILGVLGVILLGALALANKLMS
ncbi:MAG: DUF3592 domain-containing protein [Cytophagales bacterium]|nr:DUF3592 domain-containing protein [Cytophagales bacterium]